jgi:dipeptidyl aminopeptidase/acylaminoacyl peptidase
MSTNPKTANPKTAPYGSWRSPITSDLIVSQSIGLSEARFDGDAVYWVEARPQEQGRNVVVCAGAEGKTRDVVPPPFSARTRVHEYGGGAWTIARGVLFFSNFADGRLYRIGPDDRDPTPLTPAPPAPGRQWRFADGIIDQKCQRWIGVREDHTGPGEAVNSLVAVDLAQPGMAPGEILAEGHDFFASPRLSPDGRHLAWLTWDHPNMPWNGTTLYVAELNDGGAIIGTPRVVAGGPAESIFQPEWSPDGGELCFVSDRSGWWNLYCLTLPSGEVRSIAPMAAEFGQPQWVFGMATYAFAGSNRIVCSFVEAGLSRLAVLDLASGALRRLDMPFTQFTSLRAHGDHALFIAGAPSHPSSVVLLDIGAGDYRILKKSTDILDHADLNLPTYLTAVEPITFPTAGGSSAFALFYPPRSPDFVAPDGDRPPLLVRCHGGPTSAASATLNLGIQYWTSRGIAVLDVNYRGSTGFGRAYRDALERNWGVADVEDCINGTRFLAERGLVDQDRMVITGGSAGGYTTLAALVFHDVFRGGASYYGVSDIAALARDTHKFESRYLDWLIGPYPQEEALYRERSPLFQAERLSRPVIFFQGDEDAVVPPNQTEAMVEALRRRGIPVGYYLFAGEQHGFRKAANIQRALDAELYFYALEVFKVGLVF